MDPTIYMLRCCSFIFELDYIDRIRWTFTWKLFANLGTKVSEYILCACVMINKLKLKSDKKSTGFSF